MTQAGALLFDFLGDVEVDVEDRVALVLDGLVGLVVGQDAGAFEFREVLVSQMDRNGPLGVVVGLNAASTLSFGDLIDDGIERDRSRRPTLQILEENSSVSVSQQGECGIDG